MLGAHPASCAVVEVGDIGDFKGYPAHREVLYARLNVCGLTVSISQRPETSRYPGASVPARPTPPESSP